MIDELVFGGIAVLSLVALFTTRRYMNRLEEVAEEMKKIRKEMKRTRRWFEAQEYEEKEKNG